MYTSIQKLNVFINVWFLISILWIPFIDNHLWVAIPMFISFKIFEHYLLKLNNLKDKYFSDSDIKMWADMDRPE